MPVEPRGRAFRFNSGAAIVPCDQAEHLALCQRSFSMPIYVRGSHGTLHVRAPHIFLARPVQPAELVKCVRELLENELGKLCLEVDIARRLGMDRRSLNRHLSSQGTTFRKIYRQVLLEASQRLLETDASVSDVAKALGFSELSAFTHAFRRRSGETPSSWKCSTHGRKQS